MTPGRAQRMYERQLGQHERVGIVQGGSAPVMARARVTGNAPSDVEGSIQQGARRACVLVSDLVTGGATLPLTPDVDRLQWDGNTLTITNIDDATVRVGGVTIAYWLDLSGA